MNIKDVLQQMIAKGASDLHLKVGTPPILRLHGSLTTLDMPAPTVQDLVQVAQQILTPIQREIFESSREIDFAFGVPRLARFRANFYVQRGTIAMAFRYVPVEIRPLDELNLPPVLRDVALKPRGLILVTGQVGSGKSTTLASMIDIINTETPSHIITVEDPIEFLHRDKRSIVSQREVGSDTSSYPDALRYILRQDPDVILIGEIRDAETMKVALTAADTGHLVLSTLHTVDAAQTVSRIITFFPPHQHQEIRYLLASTLQAVVSQRLVADPSGQGRFPAVEVLIATGTIREYIRDPEKTALIRQAIQEGFIQYRMQTFDQSLMQLFKERKISLEAALRASSNPHEFSLRIKGIQASSDTTWDRFEGQEQEPQPADPLGAL